MRGAVDMDALGLDDQPAVGLGMVRRSNGEAVV
jgi:hypothetical protein